MKEAVREISREFGTLYLVAVPMFFLIIYCSPAILFYKYLLGETPTKTAKAGKALDFKKVFILSTPFWIVLAYFLTHFRWFWI